MLAKLALRWRLLAIIISILAFGSGAVAIAIAYTQLDIYTLMAGGLTADRITGKELREGKLKPVILVDVREPEEYAEDHIEPSYLVPLTEIERGIGINRIKAIVKRSTQANQLQPTVLLYCSKGPRSAKAYHLLEKSGIKIAFLSGGITAWRATINPAQDRTVLSAIVQPSRKLKSAAPAPAN